jgi:hypothetical protein
MVFTHNNVLAIWMPKMDPLLLSFSRSIFARPLSQLYHHGPADGNHANAFRKDYTPTPCTSPRPWSTSRFEIQVIGSRKTPLVPAIISPFISLPSRLLVIYVSFPFSLVVSGLAASIPVPVFGLIPNPVIFFGAGIPGRVVIPSAFPALRGTPVTT